MNLLSVALFHFFVHTCLLQAEGVHVSPYSIRRALENTCVPIGSLPEDRLSTGMGLIQVDR